METVSEINFEDAQKKMEEESTLHLERLKIKQCRDFAQRYMRLMGFLFSIIISKRIFFDATSNISKLGFHLTIIALFMLSFRLHRISDLATRVVPLIIAFLSYYGHT